ncbi:hypothetical protein J4771_05095 [Candidatus Kaistella beijingensis]|uniref:hypothetical protein n=1 Tax=Candidatus Kaistella beijingensis TaxID=2820270 RepID=UPI001CC4BB24|nr:hypothetical protein [Candidatus Kaistella beijingensis]UBB90725.1 hypothetical protein J4771_05095 [Candidatus Kaistella beijingensis]
MKTFKSLSVILLTVFLAIFSNSCRSDSNDDNPSGSTYPKQVSITYKVTSATTSSASIIKYKNETGGDTDVANPSLPYSKTINRTVNKGDVLTLAYGTNTNQTVKLEILVNNASVLSQEFTTTSGAIVYQFP